MMLSAEAIIPPTETTRWTASRKAGLVAAIKLGMITRETAYQRYCLSEEELQEWQRDYTEGGVEKLKVTRRIPNKKQS